MNFPLHAAESSNATTSNPKIYLLPRYSFSRDLRSYKHLAFHGILTLESSLSHHTEFVNCSTNTLFLSIEREFIIVFDPDLSRFPVAIKMKGAVSVL